MDFGIIHFQILEKCMCLGTVTCLIDFWNPFQVFFSKTIQPNLFKIIFSTERASSSFSPVIKQLIKYLSRETLGFSLKSTFLKFRTLNIPVSVQYIIENIRSSISWDTGRSNVSWATYRSSVSWVTSLLPSDRGADART